jgi:hypothetical protein
MSYATESWLPAMLHSAESWLPAMQHRGEFLLKIFSIEIRLDCRARSSSAILREKNSALCNITRSQNIIAQSQLTELRLCPTAFKATIKQKCIHRKSTLPYSSKMRSQKWGCQKKFFDSALCCIEWSRFFDSLRPNISAFSKRNSKIF